MDLILTYPELAVGAVALTLVLLAAALFHFARRSEVNEAGRLIDDLHALLASDTTGDSSGDTGNLR